VFSQEEGGYDTVKSGVATIQKRKRRKKCAKQRGEPVKLVLGEDIKMNQVVSKAS
jgi:hypothetical protein